MILAFSFIAISFFQNTQAWAAPQAQAPVEPGTSGAGTGLTASNYCVGCHTTSDERLQSALTWNGPIERQISNPCPASATIYEELYYTERLMLAIDQLYATLPYNTQAEKIFAGAQSLEQTYSRLLDTPFSRHLLPAWMPSSPKRKTFATAWARATPSLRPWRKT